MGKLTLVEVHNTMSTKLNTLIDFLLNIFAEKFIFS